jgi:hypothetical protein
MAEAQDSSKPDVPSSNEDPKSSSLSEELKNESVEKTKDEGTVGEKGKQEATPSPQGPPAVKYPNPLMGSLLTIALLLAMFLVALDMVGTPDWLLLRIIMLIIV